MSLWEIQKALAVGQGKGPNVFQSPVTPVLCSVNALHYQETSPIPERGQFPAGAGTVSANLSGSCLGCLLNPKWKTQQHQNCLHKLPLKPALQPRTPESPLRAGHRVSPRPQVEFFAEAESCGQSGGGAMAQRNPRSNLSASIWHFSVSLSSTTNFFYPLPFFFFSPFPLASCRTSQPTTG